MKALIIYDSTYGHTEKIALAVGEAIAGQVLKVGRFLPSDVIGFDLLVVGSPTHGGRPTQGISDLLTALPVLESIPVATFDTRTVRWSWIFGYAAPRIARSLEKTGGRLVLPPEGFLVLGTKGPLKDGEIERAAGWARVLSASAVVGEDRRQ